MAVGYLKDCLFLVAFTLLVKNSFGYPKEIKSCLLIKPGLEEKMFVSRMYASQFTFLSSSLKVSSASHKKVM